MTEKNKEIKNIAIITMSPEWMLHKEKSFGGGSVVSYNTYLLLEKLGYNITVICPGDKEEYKENNLTIKYINSPLGTSDFTQKAMIEASKCDRIINFLFSNNTDGLLIQSHSYLYRTMFPHKIFSPLKRYLYRKKIAWQNNIFKTPINYAFAVSKSTKEDYEMNFGLKNIKVAYPGCQQIYNEFLPSHNEVLTFGFIYNSSINKSGHYLIFVLAIAKLLGMKFKLNMILPEYKTDCLLSYLIKILNLEENTTIFNKVNDLSDFYKSIDCVIMPSIHEAFGLVPLEGLSFCKTCLVSQNIGFAEIIDKNSGFTFNRSFFLSFLIGLFKVHKMFYNNRTKFNEICKNGWEISKEYTWEKFVEELLE